MKVVCDNCGAMYKIPDDKLVKPVNKATCRQCGHRMLIPRPRSGADPDERTLVTAVPPTPAPPPMRDEGGPPTTPLHADSEEKTLPTGGRAPEETRWIRNDLRPQPGKAAAAVADPQDRSARTERLPAHGGPAVSAQPERQAPPALSSPRPRAIDEIDLSAEIETEDEDDAPPPPRAKKPSQAPAPRPAQAAKAAAAPPAHDPRGDMGLALFGVVVAGLGVAILGVDSVLDESVVGYWAVIGAAVVGSVLAVGGVTGSFLVLLTSGRGRKPAWRIASVLVAILLGLTAGAIPATVRVGVDSAAVVSERIGSMIAAGPAPIEAPTLADLPPPDAPDPAVAPPADPADAAPEHPAAVADATAETPATPEPASAATAAVVSAPSPEPARTSTATRSGSTTSASTSRSSTASPEPARTTTRVVAADPEPTTSRTGSRAGPPADEKELPDDLALGSGSSSKPAASNLPEKPPMQAIDVMVKTNVNVKRCFFEYQKTEGKLPSRIDVPFTIKPPGDATDISIKQSKLSGTPLETCLIKAIRGIQFPPSQKGTQLTFPFVFE